MKQKAAALAKTEKGKGWILVPNWTGKPETYTFKNTEELLNFLKGEEAAVIINYDDLEYIVKGKKRR